MSSLAELPELVGFFSYSREDDDAFKGMLSALRDGIQRELSAQLGRTKRTFRLWQDQTAIAPGKLWESEIKKAIDESFFFIPIVTPRSVSSKYCKFEFEAFLAREKAIGRSDLVFPILYISVGALENEAKWRDDVVLSTIGRRQYVDWRSLRYLDVHTAAVREQIGHLCQKIVETLNEPWVLPEERRGLEEAKARQQAEEEARRLEAEAKRKTEVAQSRKQAEAESRRRAAEERRGQKAEAKQRADEEERRKRAEPEARPAADDEAEVKLRAGQGQAFAVAIQPHNVWDWLQNKQSARVITAVAALAVLLLIGVGGYAYVQHTAVVGTRQAVEQERQARAAAEAEIKRVREQAEQERALFTIQRGVEAFGDQNDIKIQKFFEDCEKACAQRSATCNVFTWYKSTGACWQYTRAELRPNANFDSGVRKAQSSLLFTIQPGIEALEVLGSPGHSLRGQSFEECQQKCTQEPTCNVFTYNKSVGTGACYLYPRANLVPNANFDSGVKK